MVKLIAIDMDGTLLNSQKEIPQENIAVIQEAARSGHKLFFAQAVCRLVLSPTLNN